MKDKSNAYKNGENFADRSLSRINDKESTTWNRINNWCSGLGIGRKSQAITNICNGPEKHTPTNDEERKMQSLSIDKQKQFNQEYEKDPLQAVTNGLHEECNVVYKKEPRNLKDCHNGVDTTIRKYKSKIN